MQRFGSAVWSFLSCQQQQLYKYKNTKTVSTLSFGNNRILFMTDNKGTSGTNGPTPSPSHIGRSFLGREVDVTSEHGGDTGDLFLAVHELLAGVGLEVVGHPPGHARHHAQQVHALPVLPQHVHQRLDEPWAARGVTPGKVTCQDTQGQRRVSSRQMLDCFTPSHASVKSYHH